MLFANGRRTVSSWLRARGLRKDYQDYYYFLGSVGRNINALGGALLRRAVQTINPGKRLLFAIDDTPTKRYGPKVEGAGMHHNPTPGPAGQKFLYAADQSAASEEGAGKENGRERRGMDCAIVAAWFVAGQFRAASAPARVARFDAASGPIDRRTHTGRQSHPQTAGRRQHQAGFGRVGCIGQVGTGDAARPAAWRTGHGEAGETGTWGVAEEDSATAVGPGRSLHGAPPCYVLGRLLAHVSYVEGQIEQFSVRIANRLDSLLPLEAQDRLDEIPGVNRKTIENVIAEIGVDMNVFPDEHHLCSWCGICPGNEESGGKRLRSRTRKGNRWLRRALTESAWAASHMKKSYFAAQYRRLSARRGKKRHRFGFRPIAGGRSDCRSTIPRAKPMTKSRVATDNPTRFGLLGAKVKPSRSGRID